MYMHSKMNLLLQESFQIKISFISLYFLIFMSLVSPSIYLDIHNYVKDV
jgi:hypothetical protein